ncbi:DUF2189 domain-containing protein [Oceaniglobus ichthyenteri]|uniref:DUF2189 domain-containing protein n=1 Tax=Oceaniglobus ichthyenteri TaxID=2136177 RepID=UPI000D34F0BF|nr:DUF2189 domain-containing protein [Oceaniglobus ichthyenteri]
MTDVTTAPATRPEIVKLDLGDLWAALALGWRDFRAAPGFGLFFGGFYAVAGIAMIVLGAGTVSWTLATSLGFPLVAPFAAVGLYDVSRRLEQGRPLDWRAVLGVVWSERSRQIPWIGGLIVIYFLFWTFLAHMIFALFLGLNPMAKVGNVFELLLSSNGLTMLAVEFVVGGVLAFLLFALTCMSLPMLLERELDFVTAMILSVQCVVKNTAVLFAWGVIVATLSLIGMVPLFLGLCVVLPVLGHATWHLYRRTLIWA